MCVAVGALLATLGTLAVSAGAAAQGGDELVRIVARKLADGRVEFGLQTRTTSGARNERLLPTKRFFPPTAAVDRWLVSSPLSMTTTPAPPTTDTTTAGYTAISTGDNQSCAVRTDGTLTCWGTTIR